jgi:tetratricopeptide (TPR) repeat protein
MLGWLWFLGSLLPVIGLVQSGDWPAMADRYAYVPSIGLFIIFSWAVPDIINQRRFLKPLMAISAGFVLLLLITLTFFQVQKWKNGIILFENSLNETGENWRIYKNLGISYYYNDRFEDAKLCYNKALSIRPDASTYNNLGAVFERQGNYKDAIFHYKKAIAIKSDFDDAYYNVGNIMAKTGDIAKAKEYYKKALKLNPDNAFAHNNLANLLADNGNFIEAIFHYNEAIRMNSNDEDRKSTRLNSSHNSESRMPSSA